MALSNTTAESVPPYSWKGLSATERAAARRDLLIASATEILSSEGESGLSIRSIATNARLNTRYFYESFETVDDLLGAAFDALNVQLAEAMLVGVDAITDTSAMIRHGISTVLNFVGESPQRASLMFVEGQSNPTLIERRRRTQDLLILMVRERPKSPVALQTLAETSGKASTHDPKAAADVVGPMFAGAMTELVLAWLRGDIVGTADEIAAGAASRIERIFD